MKIYNKFVESKKEPSNKNDIWFDGSSWKMYKEGVWRSFTLPIELAKDIEDAVKDLDLGNYLKKTDVDSALSETSTNPVENKVITERLNNIKTDTPDWNASEGKAGHIKGRSHYIDGAISIPFEHWDKRFDEDGNAIYFHTIPPDNYLGCLIREGGWQEENYVFFGTEWKSLYAVSADIRVNYDSEVGDSVLEIKLYQDADSESFLANFINNALFAYGQGEDFIYPIANEFIPNTIARQESVDELREETTALWENLDHGTFPNLTAGDLAGRGESVPAEFGFRASGGKSIKDGRAYIKRIKGNSVVWNQLYPTDWRYEERGVLSISQGGVIQSQGTTTGSYWNIKPMPSNIEGHKYLFEVSGLSSTFKGRFALLNRPSNAVISNGYGYFIHTNSDTSLGLALGFDKFTAGDVIDETYEVRVIDLTKAFPNDWQNINTIEDFNARVATLGVDLNAYNEGEVIHCNTESIKSVGDNAWDEQWENGTFNITSGAAIDGSWVMGQIRSKNPLPVLPNEEYYVSMGKGSIWVIFLDKEGNAIESPAHNGITSGNAINIFNSGRFKTPTNAAFLIFYCTSDYGDTYNHDILISLYHSGWKAQKDDQYQPYWQDTLPLPIIRKYFPDGMKLAGAAHDEIRFNKATNKWEAVQRIGSVDLRNVADIEYNSVLGAFYFALTDMRSPTTYEERATGFICSRYNASNNVAVADMPDKTMLRFPDSYIYIKDSAYTDVATFKAMLQEKRVKLYYELAEPIVTEITEDFRDYYQVADFGTEMSHSNVPSAAFSADIIYQFNAVDMLREHEAEINELQSIIATMQAQLTSLINK